VQPIILLDVLATKTKIVLLAETIWDAIGVPMEPVPTNAQDQLLFLALFGVPPRLRLVETASVSLDVAGAKMLQLVLIPQLRPACFLILAQLAPPKLSAIHVFRTLFVFGVEKRQLANWPKQQVA